MKQNKLDQISRTCVIGASEADGSELWITCLDPVSANSQKCIGSQWAVRVSLRVGRARTVRGPGRDGMSSPRGGRRPFGRGVVRLADAPFTILNL